MNELAIVWAVVEFAFANINLLQRPHADKTTWCHYQLKNLIISETVRDSRLVKINDWFKVGVAL